MRMNRADEMVAARVEAMQRELAGVISSDENLNQELRVDPEDLLKKPVRQRVSRLCCGGTQVPISSLI
jgi:hypothetical protein